MWWNSRHIKREGDILENPRTGRQNCAMPKTTKWMMIAAMLVVWGQVVDAQRVPDNTGNAANASVVDISHLRNTPLPYCGPNYTPTLDLWFAIPLHITDYAPNFRVYVRWGDGTQNQYESTDFSQSLTATNGNAVSVPVNALTGAGSGAGTASRLWHRQVTKPASYPGFPATCGYAIEIRVLFTPNNGNSFEEAMPTRTIPISVWGRDDNATLGGQMRLHNTNTTQLNNNNIPDNVYLVCAGYPINASFIDRSNLTCNGNNTVGSANSMPREIRYRYGTDGTITGMTNLASQSNVYQHTTTISAGTPQILSHVQPTVNITHSQNTNIHGTGTSANQTYQVTLESHNECNARDLPSPLNAPSTATAQIRAVALPVAPTPQIWTFCNSSAYSNSPNYLEVTVSGTGTYGMHSNRGSINTGSHSPNYPTGGTYRWYRSDASGNIIKSSKFTGTGADGSLNHSDVIFTGATFNPATSPTNAAHRINSATPGRYVFWVTYEAAATTGITCESEPSRMEWIILEDINAAPVRGTITVPTTSTFMGNGNITNSANNIVVCDGERFTLNLTRQTIDNIANTPLGRETEYIWEQTTSVSGITITPTTGEDARGQSAQISININPNTRPGTNTGAQTVTIRVHRRFRNVHANISNTTGLTNTRTCRNSYPNTGSTCTMCPSNSTTFTIIVNPLPTAQLIGNQEVCASTSTASFEIQNVRGLNTSTFTVAFANTGASAPATNTSVSNNTSFSRTVNLPAGNATMPNPTGTVTNYSISRVTDNATGCFSDYNPSAGNEAWGTFARPTGDFSRIRNWHQVRRRAALNPSFNSSPAQPYVQYLCPGTSHTWTINSPATVDLLGQSLYTSVPASSTISRSLENRWTVATTTANGQNPFTANNVTTNSQTSLSRTTVADDVLKSVTNWHLGRSATISVYTEYALNLTGTANTATGNAGRCPSATIQTTHTVVPRPTAQVGSAMPTALNGEMQNRTICNDNTTGVNFRISVTGFANCPWQVTWVLRKGGVADTNPTVHGPITTTIEGIDNGTVNNHLITINPADFGSVVADRPGTYYLVITGVRQSTCGDCAGIINNPTANANNITIRDNVKARFFDTPVFQQVCDKSDTRDVAVLFTTDPNTSATGGTFEFTYRTNAMDASEPDRRVLARTTANNTFIISAADLHEYADNPLTIITLTSVYQSVGTAPNALRCEGEIVDRKTFEIRTLKPTTAITDIAMCAITIPLRGDAAVAGETGRWEIYDESLTSHFAVCPEFGTLDNQGRVNKWRPLTGVDVASAVYDTYISLGTVNTHEIEVSVSPGFYGTRELRWVMAVTGTNDYCPGAVCATPVSVSFGTTPDDGEIMPYTCASTGLPNEVCDLTIVLEGLSSGMVGGVVQPQLVEQPNIGGFMRRWETGMWAFIPGSYRQPKEREPEPWGFNGGNAPTTTGTVIAVTKNNVRRLVDPANIIAGSGDIWTTPQGQVTNPHFPLNANGWLLLDSVSTSDVHRLTFEVTQPGFYTFVFFIKSPCGVPTAITREIEFKGVPVIAQEEDWHVCHVELVETLFTDDRWYKFANPANAPGPPEFGKFLYTWSNSELGSGEVDAHTEAEIQPDPNFTSTRNERLVTVNSSYRGCNSAAMRFMIYVKPQPMLAAPAILPGVTPQGTFELCHNEIFQTWITNRAITDLDNVAQAATYSWTSADNANSDDMHPNPGINEIGADTSNPNSPQGPLTTGTPIQNFTLTAVGNKTTNYPSYDRGVITVRAEVEGCISEPMDYDIKVNPTPLITVAQAEPYCSNEWVSERGEDGLDHTEFWSEVSDVFYIWSITGEDVGFSPTTQTNRPVVRIPDEVDDEFEKYVITQFTTADNTQARNVRATVTIDAVAELCTARNTFEIVVKPRPVIRNSAGITASFPNSVRHQAVCSSLPEGEFNQDANSVLFGRQNEITSTFANVLPVLHNVKTDGTDPHYFRFSWQHHNNIGQDENYGKRFDPSVQQALFTDVPQLPTTELHEEEVEKWMLVSTIDNSDGWTGIQLPVANEGANRISEIYITPYMDGCEGETEMVRLTALQRPVLVNTIDNLSFSAFHNDSVCSRQLFEAKKFEVNTEINPAELTNIIYSWTVSNNPSLTGVGQSIPNANNNATASINAPEFTARDNTTGNDNVDIVSVTARTTLPSDLVSIANAASSSGCVSHPDTFFYRVFPAPVIDPIRLVTEQNIVNNAYEFCKDEHVVFEPFTSTNVDSDKGVARPQSFWVKYLWDVSDTNIGIGMDRFPLNADESVMTIPDTTHMRHFYGANHTGDNTVKTNNKIPSIVTVSAITSDGCPQLTNMVFRLTLKPNPQMLPIADMQECTDVLFNIHNNPRNPNNSANVFVNNVSYSNDQLSVRWYIEPGEGFDVDISAEHEQDMGGSMTQTIPKLPVYDPATPDGRQSGFMPQFFTNYVTQGGRTVHNRLDNEVYAQVFTWAEVDGCVGDKIDFKITVRPTPDILIPLDTLMCIGERYEAFRLTSPNFPFGEEYLGEPLQTTFSYRQAAPWIGNGTTNRPNMPGATAQINSFPVTNDIPGQAIPQISTFTLWSTLTWGPLSCHSPDTTFTITVLPRAQLAAVYQPIVVCAGDPWTPDEFQAASPVDGYHYHWNWELYDPALGGALDVMPPGWTPFKEWQWIDEASWVDIPPDSPYEWPGPPPRDTPTRIPNINRLPYPSKDGALGHGYDYDVTIPFPATQPGGVWQGTVEKDYLLGTDFPRGHLPIFVGDTTKNYYAGYIDRDNHSNQLWGSRHQSLNFRIVPQVSLVYPETHVKYSEFAKVCNGTEQIVSITINPLPNTRFNPNMDLCVSDNKAVFYELRNTDNINSASGFEWGFETKDAATAQFAPFIPNQEEPNPITPKGEFAGDQVEIFRFPVAGVWNGYITVQQLYNGCYAPVEKIEITTIPTPVIIMSYEPIIDPDDVVTRVSVCHGDPQQFFVTIDGMSNITPADQIILDYETSGNVRLDNRNSLQPWATFLYESNDLAEISLRVNKQGCPSNPTFLSARVYELPPEIALTSSSYCSNEEEWTMRVSRPDDIRFDLKWYRFVDGDTIRIQNVENRADTVTTNLFNIAGDAFYHTNALPAEMFADINNKTVKRTVLRYAAVQTNLNIIEGRPLACTSEPVFAELTILEAAIAPTVPDLEELSYCLNEWDPRYTVSINPDLSPAAAGTSFHWYEPFPENIDVEPVGYRHIGSGTEYMAWQTGTSEVITLDTEGNPIRNPNVLSDFSPAATFWVRAISRDGCPTPELLEVPLIIFPPPDLGVYLETDFGFGPVQMPVEGGCSPFTLLATNTSPSEYVNYQWIMRPGEDPTEALRAPVRYPFEYVTGGTIPEAVTLRLTGTHTLFRDHIAGAFCANALDTMIIIQPKVEANFIASVEQGCESLSVQFIAQGLSQGAFNFRYYWNLGIDNPPPHPGHYLGLPFNGPVIPPNTPHPVYDYSGLSGVPDPVRSFVHTGQPGEPQTYIVWMQADNGACFDNDSIHITVYPVPRAEFTHDHITFGSVCPPNEVIFTNLSKEGEGSTKNVNTSYTWNFGDGIMKNIPFEEPVSHFFENWIDPSPVQRTVTLFASNEFDGIVCNSTYSRSIFVNPQVRAAFTGPLAGCSPSSAQFINQSFGAISSMAWEFGNGTLSNDANPIYNAEHNENYNHTWKYERVLLTVRNNWCSDTISHPFFLLPQPVADFRIPPDQMQGCQPLTVDFENTSNKIELNRQNPPGTEYTFDFGDGNVFITQDPDEPVPHTYTNTLHTPLARSPELTAVTEWADFNLRCTSLPSIGEIFINPFIRADFVPMFDDLQCSPLNVMFRNASVGDEWFEYDFGNGHSFQGNRTNDPFVPHTFRTDNMYEDKTFTITMTAYTGPCTDTQTFDLLVRSSPTAAFRPGPPFPADYRWPAPPISIENQIILPDRNNLSYLWSYTAAGSTYPNNFSTSADPDPIPIHNWGSYRLTQRVTAPNGYCRDTWSVDIRIAPPPAEADFDDLDPICAPDTVRFINMSKNAVSQLWDFGDGYTSNQVNPTHIFTDAGVYNIILNVVGHDGERHSTQKEIVVHPTPQPNFRVAPNYLYVGQEARTYNYTTTMMPDNVTPYEVWYKWDWGDFTPIDTTHSPRHMYMSQGIYDVTLTMGTFSTPECIGTLTKEEEVQLEVAGDIRFPTIFRPSTSDRQISGGGEDFGSEPNDIIPNRGYTNFLFFPAFMSPVARYSLVIYNRQGIRLFETTDPNRGWNGYYRGRVCEEGVYVYRAEGYFQTGQPFYVTGTVVLLR